MTAINTFRALPILLLTATAAAGAPLPPYQTAVDLRDLPVQYELLAPPDDVETGASVEPVTRASGLRVIASIAGLTSSSLPLSPSGDVGSTDYLQAINTPTGASFAVFDKDGGLTAGPTSLASLGSGACASGAGSPVVLFDERADRWVLAELSATTNALCVYVSLTSDPVAGGWCGYQIDTAGALLYPQLGVWNDAYVLTGDEGSDTPVYALDRANMLLCTTARSAQRRAAPRLAGFGFQALSPADADGAVPPDLGTPAVLLRHRDDELHDPGGANPAQDTLELWQLAINWTTPAATLLSGPTAIPVSEFDSALCPPLASRACIPQPGTGVLLDPQVAVVMPRLQYRSFATHQALVGVFQTDVGDAPDHAGERWLELRNTGGGWVLHQQGTFAPDAHHRFMGSTALDADGNQLLAYNVSSTSVHPSLRVTGRQAEDPAGVMSSGETTLAAGGGASTSNLYGGRSQAGVDPEDGCTFWITAVYNPTASAATRIGVVRFLDCKLEPIFASGFEAGDTSGWSGTVP